MGIVIEGIQPSTDCDDRHVGTINHNGNIGTAMIVGSYDQLLELLHADITAEYELGEIISVEIGLSKDDRLSGIFPSDDDHVVVDGTVHNITVVDESFSLVDVYIQNNADFLCVSSKDLPVIPEIASRIRIAGKKLLVYPTFL